MVKSRAGSSPALGTNLCQKLSEELKKTLSANTAAQQ